MSKIACLLLMIFSIMGNVSLAQDSCSLQVRGLVLSKPSGEPLPHAVVFVQGTMNGAVSDDDGYYELNGVCGDTLVLISQYLGFKERLDTLILQGNKTYNLYLNRSTNQLAEVAISADGTGVQGLTNHAIARSDRKLDENLGVSLMRVAGVSSLSTGAGISKPVIRGMHSNRLVIMNNGVRLEGQQWGTEHAPAVDPALVGDIEVVKGAAGVRFGPEAMGGAVIMHPLAFPDSFGIAGWMQASAQSNGRGGALTTMLQGRTERVPWLRWRVIAAGRKRGNQHTPEYFLNNTGLEELNFSGDVMMGSESTGAVISYSQFNSNFGILSFSHIGNLSDLERAIQSNTPLDSTYFSFAIDQPFQRVEHETFKMSAHKDTDLFGRFELTYGRQFNRRSEFDRHSGDAGVPAITFELLTHTLDVVQEGWTMGRHQIDYGVSSLFQENTFQGRFFIPNYRKLNAGVFLSDAWERNDWRVTLGGRFDYIAQDIFLNVSGAIQRDAYTFARPSWSASVSKSWRSSYIVQLEAGSAWRPPNVNELYSDGLHHGAASYEVGDRNLTQEVAHSVNVLFGATLRKLRVQSEWYANYMSGFIYLQPVQPPTLTIRGAFPTFQFQQANALLYGTDLQIQYQLHANLTMKSNASLVRARNLESLEWISLMPADRISLSFQYDRWLKNWLVWIAPDLTLIDRQRRVAEGVDYLEPPAGYALLNLSVGAKLNQKSGPIAISLSVNNALNQRYRDYMNRYRYFADEIGRNFMIQLSKSF